MPSNKHQKLLEAIYDFFKKNWNTDNGDWLISMDARDFDRPKKINGSRPDFYAWSEKRLIIGEAKLKNDLKTPRSHEQIKGFIQSLADEQKKKTIFILAVMPHNIPHARQLISSIDVGAAKVDRRVIEITGWESCID